MAPQGPGIHIDSATSQPVSPSGLILPDSMNNLGGVIQGLRGDIGTQAAAVQELANAVSLLAGKQDQTGRAIPTSGVIHGRSGVPKVRAIFSNPNSLGSDQYLEGRLVSEGGVPYSVGGIRHHAARHISQLQIGTQVHQIQNPLTGELEYRTLQSDGSYSERPSTPREINSSRRGNAIKGAMGRFATGEGMPGLGDVAGMVPEIAEPLGAFAAVGAGAYEVTKMMADQRAKNAQYQAILGGSNASGFGQRFDELGFRISQLGVMGSEQAEQAFMGTSQLGLRGGERDSALNAIATQYKNLGMSVTQSLQAMNVQLEAGNTNFGQLTDSLTAVSAAAKDANINTEQARQAFINTLSTANQSLGGGAGTTASAQGLSIATSKLGQQFGLKGFNLNGIYSTQSLREIAAANGMTYDQVIARGNSDPGWINQKALGFLQQRTNESFPALGQDVNAAIKQQGLQSQYQKGTITEGEWTTVANQALKQSNAPDVQAMQQMVTTLYPGMDVNKLSPQQLVELLSVNANGQLAKNATVANPANSYNLNKTQQSRLQKSLTDYTDIAGRGGESRIFDQAALGKALNEDHIYLGNKGGEVQNQIRINYAQHIAKTGQNSGIIDQLLQNEGWKKNFEVKGEDGKTQTVSFAQLMANQNYQKQAAAGTASIIQANGHADTLSNYYNGGNKVSVPTTKFSAELTVKPTAYFQKVMKTVEGSMPSQAPSHTLVPTPASTTPGSA